MKVLPLLLLASTLAAGCRSIPEKIPESAPMQKSKPDNRIYRASTIESSMQRVYVQPRTFELSPPTFWGEDGPTYYMNLRS